MAAGATVGEITGELILRVHSEEVSLGLVTIPVKVRATESGDLVLTAKTREIRDFVQEVYNAGERMTERVSVDGGES